MENFNDILDAAYGGDGLATLTSAERELFERMIAAVCTPPSLRPRAGRNLFVKFVEEGPHAVAAILHSSAERARRARESLERQVSSVRKPHRKHRGKSRSNVAKMAIFAAQ
jgi:hypothetical protein